MMKEFKEFAMRGNVVDMAVGIIIGGAFGKIITSLVNDMIMPVVGSLTGGNNFTEKFLWLGTGDAPATFQAAQESGQPYLGWGSFSQNVFDFVIVAFCIFMMIKAMNKMKKKEEQEPEAPPEPSAEEKLLSEIRDALVNK
ncbi:MAG: large conductance mechanosensitive channel protein MscL [Planctomycetota bacterium]|nr:large conductance mechanosensitive channel protein MscL [Planctomycetota bacterium]